MDNPPPLHIFKITQDDIAIVLIQNGVQITHLQHELVDLAQKMQTDPTVQEGLNRLKVVVSGLEGYSHFLSENAQNLLESSTFKLFFSAHILSKLKEWDMLNILKAKNLTGVIQEGIQEEISNRHSSHHTSNPKKI